LLTAPRDPIFNRPAIHPTVIVVSRRNRSARKGSVPHIVFFPVKSAPPTRPFALPSWLSGFNSIALIWLLLSKPSPDSHPPSSRPAQPSKSLFTKAKQATERNFIDAHSEALRTRK
jgi:hypothetical protein